MVAWLSLRALPEVRRPPALLLVLTFMAMAKFYAHELVLGQVNMLFAVLAALVLVWMMRGRDAGAGLLLALAAVVKPYAAIFAPWLLTRRRRTAFVAMMAGLAVLLLLPVVRYGWQGNLTLLQSWWQTVASTTVPNLANQDNVSLGAAFARWMGGPGPAASLLAAATAGILLLLAGIVIAGRGALRAPEALEGGLLLLLIPLLSPQGWDYVLLIATPAVMLLLNYLAALPPRLRFAAGGAIALTALLIYDIVGRDVYGMLMRLSIVTICATIEIAALVALRFRRVA